MKVFKQLRDRKILSSLAFYLGSSWVLIEVLNFLMDKYGWPAVIIDVGILLFIFGFPSILVHAWFINAKNYQKYIRREIFFHCVNASLLTVLVINAWDIEEILANSNTVNNERSIAVLPFKNLSSVQDNQYFADGVIEAVRNHLGKINGLWVTSGNSTEQFRDSSKSGQEIASELGVAFLLSGSVQRHDDKIRIIVELSDAKQNKQIWTELFDRQYEDVLELQSEIALEIANELDLKLSPEVTSQITKKYTDNIEAYNYYLEGQSLLRTGRRMSENVKAASELFEQAIFLDPNFSLAYIELANSYLSSVLWGYSSSNEIIPIALETVMKAIEIDNTIGESYEILGFIKFFQVDFQGSEKYLLKAIKLNPNYAESYVWLGNLYSLMGRKDEALSSFDKAIALDPKAIIYKFFRVHVFYYNEWYNTGIAELEADPLIATDNQLKWILASMYCAKGEHAKSIDLFKQRGGNSDKNWALGYAYGINGNTDSARYVLDYLLKKRETQYVPGYMISTLYVALGESEMALDWLDIALKDGPDYTFIFGVIRDPRMDAIADHPRFRALRNKLMREQL
jgi:TolB-like protein